jgi:hypothetical protein
MRVANKFDLHLTITSSHSTNSTYFTDASSISLHSSKFNIFTDDSIPTSDDSASEIKAKVDRDK